MKTVSHFFMPPQHALTRKTEQKTEQNMYVGYTCFSIRLCEILTMRSVENYKNFQIYRYFV